MSELKIVPLGGMGRVTLNMFLYQYENEILIVDCGIGFPDVYMPGVDAIIPDITYLLKELKAGKKIVGLVFSHGHEDHIGALPYLSPELPDFPIYASPLTAGFAELRLKDKGANRSIKVIADNKPIKIGTHFTLTTLAITHSVPDSKHLVIETPEGIIYHGSDFKLDDHPIDGVLPDFESIEKFSQRGILLALIDCLRIERDAWTKSESTTGPVIAEEMRSTKGKFVITLMSSHVHRIQQTVDAAHEQRRKVVFIGRSVEQNVKVAVSLGKLDIPKGLMIDKRDMPDVRAEDLCVIIAGSQGQEGSSLVRAIYGEHRQIQITQRDKVLFSAESIPGNEVPYYNAIDELSRNQIQVVYPDIKPDIHQSGHASAPEQKKLVSLLKPKYLMPVGGADRHRNLFKQRMTTDLRFQPGNILVPANGEVLGCQNQQIKVIDRLTLKPRIVDGLGIGDVGPVVLSDRRSLSQAGIIVLVLPRHKGKLDLNNIMVVSRGFVFMKQADEVIDFIKEKTVEIIHKAGRKIKDEELKRLIEKRLSRRLYKVIKREPMIVPVILDQ